MMSNRVATTSAAADDDAGVRHRFRSGLPDVRRVCAGNFGDCHAEGECSYPGFGVAAGMVAYAASKAAVAALTAALAEEVAKDGILVNAVAPSIMDTPANRAAMPKANYDLWPKVAEVAATISSAAGSFRPTGCRKP
jgi:NAD(P)-dependent dehydrogenase (short-subunit alcohol dehydrogenase family)